MSVIWSVRRESGRVKTFEAAGIRTVTRTLSNQQADTGEFSMSTGEMLAREPWLDQEHIAILRDGALWFHGRYLGASPFATGSAEGIGLRIAGPWWHLEHLPYMQSVLFATDPLAVPTSQAGLVGGDQSARNQSLETLIADVTPTVAEQLAALQELAANEQAGTSTTAEDVAMERKLSSTIFLGEDEGTRVDTKEMILAVLDYAISKGVPIAKGVLDGGVSVPREELRAVTCAEAIKRCLRWTPDQAVWFDYTTDPATIHIRTRANRALHTVTLAAEECESVELAERRDLVVSGVRLEYLRNHEREGFRFRTLDVDEAGPDPTGIGSMVVPIELTGSYLADGQVVAPEPVPAGIAALIFAAYSETPYDGSVRLVREDVGTEKWTSKVLRVLGGNPAWQTMRADIQSSTDTTHDGRSEISVGPPHQLGAVDLVGLMRQSKATAPSLTDALLHNGGSTPATSPTPTNSTDPRLKWGPVDPPEVILYQRSFVINFGGAGIQSRGSSDWVYIYTAPGGAFVAPYSVDGLASPGDIIEVSGVRVGVGRKPQKGTLEAPIAGSAWTYVLMKAYQDGSPSQFARDVPGPETPGPP